MKKKLLKYFALGFCVYFALTFCFSYYGQKNELEESLKSALFQAFTFNVIMSVIYYFQLKKETVSKKNDYS